MVKTTIRRGRNSTIPLLALLLWFSTGCGSSQSIDLPRLPKIANPGFGPAVKIVRVTDRRVFSSTTLSRMEPSLPPGQVDNEANRARAIARAPMTRSQVEQLNAGDAAASEARPTVLLDQRITVPQTVALVVARALRASGYNVVATDAPGAAEAAPVEIDILRFWGWFEGGGSGPKRMSFDTAIDLHGPWSNAAEGLRVDRIVTLKTSAGRPGARQWRNTLTGGIHALEQETRAKIRAAATP